MLSPTFLRAAKWITASILFENTWDKKFKSLRSPWCKTSSVDGSIVLRLSSTVADEFTRLSIMWIFEHTGATSMTVWLPIYPSPPVTKIFIYNEG